MPARRGGAMGETHGWGKHDHLPTPKGVQHIGAKIIHLNSSCLGVECYLNPTWKFCPHKSGKIDYFNLFFGPKGRLEQLRGCQSAEIQ